MLPKRTGLRGGGRQLTPTLTPTPIPTLTLTLTLTLTQAFEVTVVGARERVDDRWLESAKETEGLDVDNVYLRFPGIKVMLQWLEAARLVQRMAQQVKLDEASREWRLKEVLILALALALPLALPLTLPLTLTLTLTLGRLHCHAVGHARPPVPDRLPGTAQQGAWKHGGGKQCAPSGGC